MRELDHKEGWAPKNWYFWIVMLDKTLESPLDGLEIKLINPKGNQPWIFIGEDWYWISNTLAAWCYKLIQWKRLWCWERLKVKRRIGLKWCWKHRSSWSCQRAGVVPGLPHLQHSLVHFLVEGGTSMPSTWRKGYTSCNCVKTFGLGNTFRS